MAGKTTSGIGDEAVKSRTGRSWSAWFKILDAAGGKKMSHPEIVEVLSDRHGVPPWWRQMITVEYERARGLRAKNQTPAGYQVSVSRTIAVPLSALYAAWKDGRSRARWLDAPGMTVRKATANKSMRITWGDGKTNVEVHFLAKGRGKSQVTVQHSKLAGAKDVARRRATWKKALDALQETLSD